MASTLALNYEALAGVGCVQRALEAMRRSAFHVARQQLIPYS